MSITSPFKFWNENPVIVNELSEKFDSVVVVCSSLEIDSIPPYLYEIFQTLKIQKEADEAFEETPSFLVPNISEHGKIKKLVYSPTGPLNRDYDDVRRFSEAALRGIKRILAAGGKKPLLAVLNSCSRFQYPELASVLGAGEAIYVPLEVRESLPDKRSKVQALGFCSPKESSGIMRVAAAIESGRVLCRDIGGSDPERMAAPNVAIYVQELFANTPINVKVIEDQSVLEKEYPLLAAVNRAAKGVERHRARVIHLSYEPEGPVEKTLVLVGKGVTYDTGGADVKINGGMAGMHRDKCGAAAVAGFFQTIAALKPKHIKVLGAMAMVRNSIGSESYVADEIITSRIGARVRIGNTDAEGRMAMADVLCEMKEKVMNEKNPYLFTIATLTGHAVIATGKAYSIIMDNGPANEAKVGLNIQASGNEFGDLFEVSTIRREDYDFNKGKSEYEDLLQCNNKPSTQTQRGHQAPAAFLIMASGLDKHGLDSNHPIKYSHIDIAGSSGSFPGIPSGAPIPALTRQFLLN